MNGRLFAASIDVRDVIVPDVDIPVDVCSSSSSCVHPYLLKLEDVYVCWDCKHKMTLPEDADRIAMEKELELKTLPDVIPQGMTVGKMSQMRGIKIKFIFALTEKFDCWDWTAYEVNSF